MKNFKKILTLLTVCVLATSIILTGCGEKITPPEKSAEAYFSYVLTGDTTKLKEYNIPTSELESTFKSEMSDFKSSFADEFKSSGFDITDDELNQIIDSLLLTVKKLDPKIEATDVQKDAATVKITCSTIELQKMIENASTATQNELKASKTTSEKELLKEFKDSYIKNISKLANEIKPSGETKEFTYTFKKSILSENGKDVTVWMPEDDDKFSTDINTLVQ